MDGDGVGVETLPSLAGSEDRQATRKPTKLAWGILGVIAVAAIAIPFMHDKVLMQDDFTSPEMLREWPEDGTTLAYVDGEYRVAVPSANGTPFGVRDLPHAVSGMTIAVDARTIAGSPTTMVQCVSEVSPASSSGSVSVSSSYVFAFIPGGHYVIAKVGQHTPVGSGTIATDGSGTLTVGCLAGAGGTTLTMQVGAAAPVTATDPDGLNTFSAIALGAYSKSAGAEVSFDNLRTVEAS
jgi:hypothetical protein